MIPPDLFSLLGEILPSGVFTVFIFYAGFGTIWALIGWIPLRGLARRVRSFSEAYENFVQGYLFSYTFFFRVSHWFLIPVIASGVVNRSFWGRSFRNLEPDEAERIADSRPMTRAEAIYSKAMLVHTGTIALIYLLFAAYLVIHWGAGFIGKTLGG